MKSAMLLAMTFGLASCATTSIEPEWKETEVVERMGEKSETPEWATGEKIIWQEGADLVFVHTMTMTGDSRSEACMKAAALESKTEMLRYIKDNVTSAGQLNEADAISDPVYEALTAFFSKGSVSGSSVKERYWEKVTVSEASGMRALKMRCAAKVAIQKSELERQMREASNPKAKGNPEIRDALIKAQKEFIEGVSNAGSTSNVQ